MCLGFGDYEGAFETSGNCRGAMQAAPVCFHVLRPNSRAAARLLFFARCRTEVHGLVLISCKIGVALRTDNGAVCGWRIGARLLHRAGAKCNASVREVAIRGWCILQAGDSWLKVAVRPE